MIGTIAQLFEAAGYKDYKSLPVMEFVRPKNRLRILSRTHDDKITKEEVTGLIYKGEAKSGIKVISKSGIFLGTEEHLLWEDVRRQFIPLKECLQIENFTGVSTKNEREKVFFEAINESFSILDIEVENTHCYFSGGLLSHNSFGGQAKALGEFLRKYNILCSNYKTTLFWISQERASMNMMSHLPGITGGEAPKFYASTVQRATKTDVIKDGNNVVGIEMRLRNYKSKVGIPFRDSNLKLYYNGGFKPDEEYIQFLVDLEIVTQKGAYFSVPGVEKSIQGRDKLQAWLNEHTDKYTQFKHQVDEMLTGTTKLDANNVAEEEDIDMTKINDIIEDDIVDIENNE
jgi:hypothetical protein